MRPGPPWAIAALDMATANAAAADIIIHRLRFMVATSRVNLCLSDAPESAGF
jgi:hypothetical protein